MRELNSVEIEGVSGAESLAYEIGQAYGAYVAEGQKAFLITTAYWMRGYVGV